MDIISYTRVSTVRQAIEGESLDAQRQRIRTFAIQHGHTILAEFSDEGVSGRSTDGRPGVQQAVELACRKRGALVIASLSRLARNTSDALSIGNRLEKAHARLVSLNEAVDTSTPTGRLVWTMLAAVNCWLAESGQLATVETLAHMRRKRMRVSGIIGYGFRAGGDDGVLIPVPEEQAVLTQMQSWRSAGWSYPRIAQELEARGIKTKQGRDHWNRLVVRQILVREAEIASAAA
ncbi:MAG: recombinase family protein [Planctomycetota bacterium]